MNLPLDFSGIIRTFLPWCFGDLDFFPADFFPGCSIGYPAWSNSGMPSRFLASFLTTIGGDFYRRDSVPLLPAPDITLSVCLEIVCASECLPGAGW